MPGEMPSKPKANAEPEGPPPEPETEEQREYRLLQEKINSSVNESLESTRRMLSMCEESKEAGIKTLVFLDEQGEQLDRIEEGMDKINTDMKDAEKSLEGLEKCCGLCVLPWKKQKKFEENESTWKMPEDGQVNADGPRMVVGGAQGPTGPLIARITNDAREDEMEENLQQVGSMVGNLRNMAVDMGNEIDSQNRALDRINSKATSNEKRIQEANKRAHKLLAS